MAREREQADRLTEQVGRICAAAQDPLSLLQRVARAVRPVVGYDAAGWLLVDPDTLLMTGVYAEQVDREAHLALIESELVDDDVGKYHALAAAERPVAALSAATGGDLARSARWRRVYEPRGFGDELRCVFRSGRTAWGLACLTRVATEPFFDEADVALVGRLAPHVGNGLRTCLVLGDLPAGGEPLTPGMVVLHDDGSVESVTPEAEGWLDDLAADELAAPIVLHEVAHRARALADHGVPGPPARARARSRSGEWLVFRAARLPGDPPRTAVVVEPARRADVAPILVHLHQLTPREREVTQALLRGLSTAEIAHRLWITPDTLRSHVKSVFTKLGVASRPELAALLSHEPQVRLSGE